MWKYVAVLALIGVVSTVAQKPGAERTREQWEYCRMQQSSPGDASAPRVEATATVCVITEAGCRFENVVVSETPELREGGRRYQAFRVAEIANAKALTQLGKQGWEMIAPPAQEGATIYLKRRM